MKRLFLFAGYDADGVVGPSLIYYVSSLAKYGDVIVVMDSNCSPEEIGKFSGLAIHSEAVRHREYDFGSYKRAFRWAEASLSMEKYDILYLVNDSVFGPLCDLDGYFGRMEAMGKDAFSFVINPHHGDPHLQSWFVGLRRDVFLSEWFHDFIMGVTLQESKAMVCVLYETGLTRLLVRHGVTFGALYKANGKKIYRNVKGLFRKGLPFIKKSSFIRHGGNLGASVKYVLDHVDANVREVILDDASRLWGKEYIMSFLTYDPFRIFARTVNYAFVKFFHSMK